MQDKSKLIQKIESLVNNTLECLQMLTPDTFDIYYYAALANLKRSRELREDLDTTNLSEDLIQRIKKINITAKLIKKEYDNVIRNYASEMDKLRLEMRNTGNKRKLASYSRGGL